MPDATAPLAERFDEVGGDELAERAVEFLPVGLAELPARDAEEQPRSSANAGDDRKEHAGGEERRPRGPKR